MAVAAAMASLTAGAHAATEPPDVVASSYTVVDGRTGAELGARAPTAQSPMASTTKIMTALITLERADLDDVVTVPPEAIIGGTSAGLVAGEQLSVRDLLTGLLVASGNDAAVALATFVGGSRGGFVDQMNARATELGLRDTRFTNPHGLDEPGHHSSARDLTTLSREAMKDEVFAALVGRRRASIPGRDGFGSRQLESKNELLDIDPSADGIKTGFTAGAGYAIVARATRPVIGPIYVALLGSSGEQRRAVDAKSLLDWGFRRFAHGTLITGGRPLASVQVLGTDGERVALVAPRSLTVRLDAEGALRRRIIAPPTVAAPVARGQRLGVVELLQGERVVGRRPLVAARAVDSPGHWERLRAGLRRLAPL